MTAREDWEKLRSSRENLSKFFYDLAKATFTAMVVGDVVTMFLKEDVTTISVWLFVTGLVTTSLLSTIGYRISKLWRYGSINYDIGWYWSSSFGIKYLVKYQIW